MVMETLLEQATCDCTPQYLKKELEHLDIALQANRYSTKEVRRAIRLRKVGWVSAQERVMAYLSYIKGVADTIERLLEIHRLKSEFRPMWKVRQHLKPAYNTV